MDMKFYVMMWAIFFGLASLPAKAKEFPSHPFNGRAVACDTLEQAETLMEAWRETGFHGHIMQYRVYTQTPSPQGAGACGVVTGPMRGIAQHGVYEGLDPPPDAPDKTTGYIIEMEMIGGPTFFAITPFPLALPGQGI